MAIPKAARLGGTAVRPAAHKRPRFDRRPVKDCLDCTISRMQHRRLCFEHWREFALWLALHMRTMDYRHATPTERDRMVRRWVETEADIDSPQSTPVRR